MTETDQSAPFFIPKPERERFHAREKSHRLDLLKKRIRLVASLQVVIGNARTQMMDVMKTDIARKPLQNLGQFIKGTALQRGRRKAPVLAALPIDTFKLVLHIKQPHPRAAGRHENNQLNQQISFPAKNVP